MKESIDSARGCGTFWKDHHRDVAGTGATVRGHSAPESIQARSVAMSASDNRAPGGMASFGSA